MRVPVLVTALMLLLLANIVMMYYMPFGLRLSSEGFQATQMPTVNMGTGAPPMPPKPAMPSTAPPMQAPPMPSAPPPMPAIIQPQPPRIIILPQVQVQPTMNPNACIQDGGAIFCPNYNRRR